MQRVRSRGSAGAGPGAAARGAGPHHRGLSPGRTPLAGANREAIGLRAPEFEKMARTDIQEDTMGKTGRKRRARKKKGANHGKRPNA
ncbi:hypothetical protein GCM10007231_30350 [Nocardioides daphniae]|uniref:Uncharacterized protein n=8 Tax=Propionibacteriales TaxID=85009 RepID=A0ABQ1QK22_9ACTN|nr:hypothetical protein GCM10007231_30350 [Nocardioides daphniae]